MLEESTPGCAFSEVLRRVVKFQLSTEESEKGKKSYYYSYIRYYLLFFLGPPVNKVKLDFIESSEEGNVHEKRLHSNGRTNFAFTDIDIKCTSFKQLDNSHLW